MCHQCGNSIISIAVDDVVVNRSLLCNSMDKNSVNFPTFFVQIIYCIDRNCYIFHPNESGES